MTTGDIEDAPGLDSLETYQVEIKDGKIVVTASLDKVKQKKGSHVVAKARKPIAATKAQSVVVVGGGAGAIHTLEALRLYNYDGKITVLSQEPYAPIDRTKLSKGLVDEAKAIEWRSVSELKDLFGVDFRDSTTVSEVDTEGRTVTTSTGEKVKYDFLVLSPGSFAKRIPIEGKDLPGVVTIRHVDDIKAITTHLGKDSDIVVIGTSFIGLEAVLALTGKETRSLTVVGVDKIPFEAMLGADIGKNIVKSLEDKGVKFHLGANITKITGKDGRVSELHIEGKEPLPATVVIMGTGVGPATSFLKDSFTLEKDGGLLVDKYLRVQGKENVFAIGDIAHYPQFPDNFSRRVEHWNVAGNHGRHVAHTIAHPDDPQAYELVPIFWSSIGGGLRYVGTGAKFTEQWVDGEGLKFVLYQAKEDGTVTTVASIGRDPYVAKASELLRLGVMPKLAEIKSGKVGGGEEGDADHRISSPLTPSCCSKLCSVVAVWGWCADTVQSWACAVVAL